ncbi:MAG: hypothetical protein ABI876_09645 [Bacteroidota bacterium]
MAKPLVAPAFARMGGQRENGRSSDEPNAPHERLITREEHQVAPQPPAATGAVEWPKAPAPQPPEMPATVAWSGLQADRQTSQKVELRERAIRDDDIPAEPIRRARRGVAPVDDIVHDDRAGMEQPSLLPARRHDAINDAPAPALPPLVPEQRREAAGQAGFNEEILAGDHHKPVERRRENIQDDIPRNADRADTHQPREQNTAQPRTMTILQPLVPVEPKNITPRIDRLEQRMAEERGRREEPAAAAPTIQVTIGRIEVRATTTTAPAQRRERAGAQIMSIDDYLRQRTGGSGR